MQSNCFYLQEIGLIKRYWTKGVLVLILVELLLNVGWPYFSFPVFCFEGNPLLVWRQAKIIYGHLGAAFGFAMSKSWQMQSNAFHKSATTAPNTLLPSTTFFRLSIIKWRQCRGLQRFIKPHRNFEWILPKWFEICLQTLSFQIFLKLAVGRWLACSFILLISWALFKCSCYVCKLLFARN